MERKKKTGKKKKKKRWGETRAHVQEARPGACHHASKLRCEKVSCRWEGIEHAPSTGSKREPTRRVKERKARCQLQRYLFGQFGHHPRQSPIFLF